MPEPMTCCARTGRIRVLLLALAVFAAACGGGDPAEDSARPPVTAEPESTVMTGLAAVEQEDDAGASGALADSGAVPVTGTEVVPGDAPALETGSGTDADSGASLPGTGPIAATPDADAAIPDADIESDVDAESASPSAGADEDDPPTAADDSRTETSGDSELDNDGGNSAPTATGVVPAQVVAAGRTKRVLVNSYFRDADGDVLTLTAVSSDDRIVTASTSVRSVWLAGVAPGSATVTVTASDEDGLATEQTFEVTVENLVTSLEASGTTTLHSVGATSVLAVTAEFADGSSREVDGTQVAWTSTDPAVVSVSGGTLTAIGRGHAWVTAAYSQQAVDVPVSVRVPAVVRVLYAVPSDRDFRSDQSEAIRRAMVGVQAWYRGQLDGLTFLLHDNTPQHCRMSQPADHFSHGSWQKVVDEVQHCAPVSEGSAGFSWVIYADVVDECGDPYAGFDELGRASSGLTILAREDLNGLVDDDADHYYCAGGVLHGPIDDPYGRWEGGAAHELGHTFHLPHPPGCDEGADTCDFDALMGGGWRTYPDTYLRLDEKEALLRSVFFAGPAPSAGEPSREPGRPTVTGTVIDADGAPVGGVRVSLVADTFWGWAQTSSDGTFEIRTPTGSSGPAAVSVHAGEAADCGWLGYHSADELTKRRGDADTVTVGADDRAHVEIALPASVEVLCRTQNASY